MDPRTLVAALHESVAQTAGHFQGTVTAVNAGPPKTLTVLVDGNSVGTVCRYSDAIATPAVHDVVFGRRDAQGDHIVQHRLA